MNRRLTTIAVNYILCSTLQKMYQMNFPNRINNVIKVIYSVYVRSKSEFGFWWSHIPYWYSFKHIHIWEVFRMQADNFLLNFVSIIVVQLCINQLQIVVGFAHRNFVKKFFRKISLCWDINNEQHLSSVSNKIHT